MNHVTFFPNLRTVDLLLDILKYAGFLITAATAIIGHFGLTTWVESNVEAATVGTADGRQKIRKMTKAGWWSLLLIIFGSLVALGAQIAETTRAKQKDALDQQEKEAQQKAHQEEISRIGRENQEEMTKRLAAHSVNLAEMFFQGRELDSQRAAFLEKAKLAGVDVKIPAYSNTFSASNLTIEIQKALKTIPDDLRAASAAKNQAEAERLATQSKAKEVDKVIRPHVVGAWTLLQSVLAQAQREGLITVTNIGPIPPLPDRLVFSRHETNIPSRLERFFRTNCQQQVAHGDFWVISMLPGVLESPTVTNDNYYPKVRIGRSSGGPISLTPPLAMLSFDPATAEIRITGSNAPHESDATLKAEDRVTGAIIHLLRQSLLGVR